MPDRQHGLGVRVEVVLKVVEGGPFRAAEGPEKSSVAPLEAGRAELGQGRGVALGLRGEVAAKAEHVSPRPELIELVRLRASQINGCAYCVDTHAHNARHAGASVQRVDAVAIWLDSPLFTHSERAALALTDSVTRLSETHAPESVVAEALMVLGQQLTAAILGLIISINAWNEIGVTSRCWAVPQRE